MPFDLICLDADDTLWHNMRFFDRAEQAVVDMLTPFADAGIARDAMTAAEIRNLPLYGYGAKSFTLSMIETALEFGADADAVRAILHAGRELMAHPVELFDGIADTLEALAERGPLILVTKGDLFHQETKLAASGLGDRFHGIEIVSDKKAETFERLFARHGADPARCVMAGDSLRSDIHPALAAGAWAAYVPQPLAWSHEVVALPDHPRFVQLERLAELPAWLDTLG